MHKKIPYKSLVIVTTILGVFISLQLKSINIENNGMTTLKKGEQLKQELKSLKKEEEELREEIKNIQNDIDKILGLEYGADDYITKPFNILEVKARIKAIIRRNKRKAPAKPEEPKVITSGKLKLDIEAKRLYIEDREIRLTVKEFDILKLLAENPGKIYGREQLLTLIWGSKYPGDARTVDVNVRRLREKVEENPAKPEYIHTKWGMGYYFQG